VPQVIIGLLEFTCRVAPARSLSSADFAADFAVDFAVIHELVEFRLVLGVAQTFQEGLEFALFVLQPLQGFHSVFVKGMIAAGCAVIAPRFVLVMPRPAAPAIMPTAWAAVFPTAHTSTPY